MGNVKRRDCGEWSDGRNQANVNSDFADAWSRCSVHLRAEEVIGLKKLNYQAVRDTGPGNCDHESCMAVSGCSNPESISSKYVYSHKSEQYLFGIIRLVISTFCNNHNVEI